MKSIKSINIKITLGVLVITGVAIIYSCKKSFLDVKLSSPVEDVYFNGEPSSYNEAVLGVYSKLIQFYNFNSLLFGTGVSGHIQGLTLLRDDDITAAQTDPMEVFSTLRSDNGSVLRYYSLFYQLINRANVFIEYHTKNADKVFADNPDQKNWYLGEVKFLRAYAYFNLWVNFGTPPMLTKRIDDVNFKPANSQQYEALDFAIAELKEAATLLPESWDDNNKGRVTKGSANGLLGKALLTKASYNSNSSSIMAEALDALNKVTGYSLVPNFANNFAGGDNENNAESLFEVQFGINAQGNNIWLTNDNFSEVGDLSGYYGYFYRDDQLEPKVYYVPTTGLQNAFEAGDPRADMSFRDGSVTKYVDGLVTGDKGRDAINNYRILRYSDILLMKAEALLFSGGSKPGAIGYINEVRQRARNSVSPASATPADRNTAETDDNTIFKWIQDERHVELFAEAGWRFLDLKRWYAAGKIDLSSFNFYSEAPGFQFDVNKHLLLPFPENEVRMSTGSLKQNSGY